MLAGLGEMARFRPELDSGTALEIEEGDLMDSFNLLLVLQLHFFTTVNTWTTHTQVDWSVCVFVGMSAVVLSSLLCWCCFVVFRLHIKQLRLNVLQS